MIDYASIAPMIGLSTFIAGFIIVLLIGRAIVELIELIEKRKARETLADVPHEQHRVQQAGQAHLSASQKAIQRYYNRNQYENKGA